MKQILIRFKNDDSITYIGWEYYVHRDNLLVLYYSDESEVWINMKEVVLLNISKNETHGATKDNKDT
jgi:hypothetical protein